MRSICHKAMEGSKSFESSSQENNNKNSAKLNDIDTFVQSDVDYRSTERSGKQPFERMKSLEEKYENVFDEKTDDFDNDKMYVEANLKPDINRTSCKHMKRIVSLESRIEGELSDEQHSVTYRDSSKRIGRITSLESALENELSDEQN